MIIQMAELGNGLENKSIDKVLWRLKTFCFNVKLHINQHLKYPIFNIVEFFIPQGKLLNLLERERVVEFGVELEKLCDELKEGTHIYRLITQIKIDGTFNMLQLAVKRGLEGHVEKVLEGTI